MCLTSLSSSSKGSHGPGDSGKGKILHASNIFLLFLPQEVCRARKNAMECCFPRTGFDFYFLNVNVQQGSSKFRVVQLDKSILLR